ncbi:C45 family autoproteolytic acyltransferase/hydolase [Eilatimonas milleporae]|uniref:Acyl-CoA:6-aminopenicillanic acid acyl transferase n=1 Tax=Eilatimonas milleporae TaxID=911205 RepID=A0A3M0C9C6_9PROT|nr:C45 family peptidase [Eilatimonas milleporae]RMB04960.1 acyl-CoA:6-aminopenicillanic acid acyl transferase [Eilatimonas milleporae]
MFQSPKPRVHETDCAEPFKRGKAYGQRHGREVAEYLKRWLASLDPPDGDVTGYARTLTRATGHLDTVSRLYPHMLEELKGLSSGADIAFDLIFAFQLMDEEWNFARRAGNGSVKGDTAGRCSVFGIGPKHLGHAILAQNMDIGSWSAGGQTLLHHAHPGGLDRFVLTFPGYLGLCGMNGAGLAVTCNALMDLPYDDAGVPVSCIVRRIMEAGSPEEALHTLQKTTHASGQCYTLATGQSLVSVEASGARTEVWPGTMARKQLCLHTNHPLWFGHYETTATAPASPSTYARLAAVRKYAGEGFSDRASALDLIGRALSSRDDPDQPVSRELTAEDSGDSQINYTFASIVFDLGDPARVFVSNGPPSRMRYRPAAELKSGGRFQPVAE